METRQRKKDVTDLEIETDMKPVLGELSKYLVMRQPLKEEEKVNEQKTQKERQAKQKGKEQVDSNSTAQEIIVTKEEAEYLISIVERPNLSVTARGTKLFGYSADKRTKLKNGLLGKKLIEEFTLDLGKEFGGTVKMLMLTDDGYKAIGKVPPKNEKMKNASFEHTWWQVHIGNDYASKGYFANLEKVLNGKAADIGVSDGKEIIAVEIELTPKNAIYNFKADIDAGFARVIIACKNQSVMKQVDSQLAFFLENNPKYDGKAKVMLLHQFPFVKKLMSEIRGE